MSIIKNKRLPASLFGALPGLLLIVSPAAWALTSTTTSLTISPSGSAAAQTTVSLTANVTASASAVTRGLVIFCNAAAAHCLDAAVIGQAQLTSAGSAIFRFRPGPGAHSLKAVFQGTSSLAASSSASKVVTIQGGATSSTTITAAGTVGDYTLTGNVLARGAGAPATGTVSFTDAAHGSALLGSASLAAASSAGFSHGADIGPAGSPNHIAAGDFNRDGIPDMAVANGAAGRTLVLLGDGDGNFQSEPPDTSGGVEANLVISDFNGDGNPDLAGLDTGTKTLTVLLGNGDGTFTLKSTTMIEASPFLLVASDFNHDGIPDIAVVGASATVSILLGAGDGTFTIKFSTSGGFGHFIGGIAAGDFNEDGIPDLAVTNFDDTVTILQGNGDGTFILKSTLGVGRQPGELVTGDFNGDGKLDLATSVFNSYGNNTIAILLGNGDGTFTPKSASTIGTGSGVIVADFNGDGITDLATANPIAGSLIVLLGKGDGTFTSSVSPNLVPYFPSSIVAADWDGDGISDLAIAYEVEGTPAPLISIFRGGVTSTLPVDVQLNEGSYQVVASYSGDANYPPSSSPPLPIDIPTAVPVFIPQPGVYQWTQMVRLTDATPAAVIHYTLDGSSPTISSAVYSSPITIGWDGLIKAFAVSPGAANSAIVTGTYKIDRPFPSPAFSLPAGTYVPPQALTLSADPTYCAHADCVIYYTRDGSTPTVRSTKYTRPIALTSPGTVTIKALATSHHFLPSPVVSATYTLVGP